MQSPAQGDGIGVHGIQGRPARRNLEPDAVRELNAQMQAAHRMVATHQDRGALPVIRMLVPSDTDGFRPRRPGRDQASRENEGETASMFLPGFDDVMKIHGDLAAAFRADGDPIKPSGARDEGLVRSACLRPATGLGDRDKYGSVFEKAAALFHSLARNHAFRNGNKRTALVTLLATLHRNGVVLDRAVRDDDVHELTVAVADGGFPGSAGRLDPDTAVGQVAGWLTSNAVARSDAPPDMRVTEFLETCEANGCRLRDCPGGTLIVHGSRSVRIGSGTGRISGIAARTCLGRLGLTRDQAVQALAEFRNVDDPGERASIGRYMGALRRLART